MKVFKSTKPVQDERFQRGCEKLREYKEGKGGLITKMDMNSEISKICSEICEENDKNINGFMEFFEADSNKDYEKKLKEKLNDYIKQIDKPAFRKETGVVDSVKDICKNVIVAFDAAKVGNIEEAEEILEMILKDYKELRFAVTKLNERYAFRGLAPFDELQPDWYPKEAYDRMMSGELIFFRARMVNESETIQEEKEINYLPYSMRNLSNDMRFSSKGKVCLYLGTTSYVCSKECRWDKKKKLYVSSFQFNEKGKNLKILNLVVLQSLLNGMIVMLESGECYKELYNSMIKVFPLVIATMFTVHTPDKERKECGEKVKYEYLLSQVLMNVLQKVEIDGVAYLSRQGKDEFEYPQMVCLAIPVNDINEQDEYGELINDFVMTSPVLYNACINADIYKRRSYINEKYPKYLKDEQRENFNAKVDYEGQTVFYQDTPYSKFDDYLINQVHRKFVY